MKKWLLYIIYICVLGMLMGSCSNCLDEDTSSLATDKISVTFTLAMNATSSRAIITDETGNSYENQIDADGLQVLFYDANGTKCLGKVENIVVFRTESEYIYQFMGNLTIKDAVDYTLSSCKVMVFANSAEMGTNTDPMSLTFDYDAEKFKNESVNIPMWGIASFTNLRLAPDTNTDLGTIYLLRAMAKVEVTLSDEVAAEFNLTGVSLNKYNEKGYCLPSDASGIEKTDDAWQNKVGDIGLFNGFSSPRTGELAFMPTRNGYVLYLSEYENTDNSAYMTVTLTDKAGERVKLNEPYLFFKNYDKGERFNVVRNHCYQYRIKSVENGGELQLTVKAQPWNTNEENWNYTETVTVKESGVIKWTEGSYDTMHGAEVYMKYTTTAECTFTIDTPVGGTWYASLIPVSGNYDAFTFEGETSGEVGKQATLRIKTTQDDVTENSKAELQIVVRTIDGRTIMVNNLLGHSSSETKYTLVQSK